MKEKIVSVRGSPDVVGCMVAPKTDITMEPVNITSYSTRVNIVCQSTVIKLRILRGRLSPGLPGWALPKCHVLIRVRQRAI